MRCIFVLDILNGVAVHAVRGERRIYEPVERFSRIVSTSEPLQILQKLLPDEVYVADLNLLMGSGDNLAVIREIATLTRTMADTGISKEEDLDILPGNVKPILGTETSSLKLIEEASLRRKIVVSVDMKNRDVLSRDPLLAARTPLEILNSLNRLSLDAIILLELDRVGTSSGLDRDFLEKAVAVSEHPLILGGGVRGEDDLHTLESLGFSGALVATAVHNGMIPAGWLAAKLSRTDE